MEIILKHLSELHKTEKNIRRHTDKQIKEYVRSIEMFGQLKPIVITEDGEILAGNGLYDALKAMGRDTCFCHVVNNLSDTQKKKLMLADNRIYELGITDTVIFDQIIRELENDFDVPGWDADLLELLNTSMTEANELIESYGTQEQPSTQTSERKAADSADNSVANTSSSPSSTASPSATVETERVIVCPKCGERICL